LRNARAFPLLPAALASVPVGFVLVRVRDLAQSGPDSDEDRIEVIIRKVAFCRR